MFGEPRIVFLAFALVAIYCVVSKACEAYRKVMSRHYGAIQLATEYSKFGFVRLPKILSAYAVGDVPTVIHEVDSLVLLCEAGPEAMLKECDPIYSSVLQMKLKDAAQVALLKLQVTEAEKALPLATAA